MKESTKELIKKRLYHFRWFEKYVNMRNVQIISEKYNMVGGGKIVCLRNKIYQQGGIGDRLRGMVTTYKFCQDLGLPFKIGHYFPFDLRDYLSPNEVDWSIDEEDVCMDLRFSKVVAWGSIPAKATGKSGKETQQWNTSQFKKRIFKASRKAYQVHVYTNAFLISKGDFSNLFHKLFRPTGTLQHLMQFHDAQIGSSYISVTTRFQNLLGDFNEGDRYHELPSEKEKSEYIDKCLNKIAEIHAANEDCKMLVTSDSQRFLKTASALPYVYTITGDLRHPQSDSHEDKAAYMKSFLDLMMISEAQKVFLLVTGRMFRSGFAMIGAAINMKEYHVIEF